MLRADDKYKTMIYVIEKTSQVSEVATTPVDSKYFREVGSAAMFD